MDFRSEDLAGYCPECGKPVLWHPIPNTMGGIPGRRLGGVLVGAEIDEAGRSLSAGAYYHTDCAEKPPMVRVPKELLERVLNRAQGNSFTVDQDRSTGTKSEVEEFEQEQADIEAIRSYLMPPK